MDLYQIIKNRRDTRHFTDSFVPDEVIHKALMAGHYAPSVGLSDPTRYYLIKDEHLKIKIRDLFIAAREKAEAGIQNEDRKKMHRSFKLEAITDSPVGLIVATDYSVLDEYVIGTVGTDETLTWSSICAIQNIWLSLTELGYSMGWVSILNYYGLKQLIGLPDKIKPLGYFCIGKPATNYNNRPMLENEKWIKKRLRTIVSEITNGSIS